MLFEIKGYAEHVTNMDRNKYCHELNRETFLQGMGYQVISFAYDDVAHRPETCKFLLRTLLSRYESSHTPIERILIADREVLRLAFQLARPLRPVDLAQHLSINHRTAIKHLQRLCQKGWLRPLERGTSKRILYYELTQEGINNGFN